MQNILADEIYIIANYINSYKFDGDDIGDIVKRENSPLACPYCKSKNFKKNGHTKKEKQKYKCNNCKKSFSNTTKTLTDYSKFNFKKWIKFIYLELNHSTIKVIANELSLSYPTIYSWRIKLYKAVENFKKTIVLSGIVEIDGYFVATNFKGQKKNLPRASLKRGSHRSKGVEHKVCFMSGVDENDNMFFEITGLGEETIEMMDKIEDKIKNTKILVCDCKGAFVNWAEKHKNVKVEYVKSGTYVNLNNYNLNTINQLHSELSDYLSIRKGISTKHLQEYLDMFLFQKYLNYHIEQSEKTAYAFDKLVPSKKIIDFKNIFLEALPVDMSQIYSKDWKKQ